MIKYLVRTNLDSAQHESWPTSFARAPVAGELVRAASGRLLRVVQVTHSMYTEMAVTRMERGPFATGRSVHRQAVEFPLVEIELHLLPGETLADDVKRSRE